MFEIGIDRVEGATVLRPRGRLTMASAGGFRDAVTTALHAGDHLVVIDLADLMFIDSSGLGALAGAQRIAHVGDVPLRVCGASDQVRLALELTNLDALLQPFATVDAALDAR